MQHLLTISEITVQYKPKKANKPRVTTSYDAVTIVRYFFPEDTIELQERFVVMYLNRSNRVIGVYHVSTGGITGTVADIRLILGVALKTAATGIILAHNHPSGSLSPSKGDIELTSKLKEVASYMEVRLFDHVILTPDEAYYSFADEGII